VTLDDLLTLMHRPADREEFLRLGERCNDNRVRRERIAAADATAAGALDTSDAEQRESLDQMMEQIQWNLRAARHPFPEPSELERMLAEYFRQ
jgi:hypothetical protein